jgi:hypothetical protein
MVTQSVIELKRGALDTVERQVLLFNVRTVRICNALKAPPAPLLEDPKPPHDGCMLRPLV